MGFRAWMLLPIVVLFATAGAVLVGPGHPVIGGILLLCCWLAGVTYIVTPPRRRR